MIEQNRAATLAFLESLNIDEVKKGFCQAVQDLKPKRILKPKTILQTEKRNVPSRECKTRYIEFKNQYLTEIEDECERKKNRHLERINKRLQRQTEIEFRRQYLTEIKEVERKYRRDLKKRIRREIELENQNVTEIDEVEYERKKSRHLKSRNYTLSVEAVARNAYGEDITSS